MKGKSSMPILEKAFDHLFDQIVIVDPERKIRRANQAFAQARGMAPEDLTGDSCFDVINRGKRDCFESERCLLDAAIKTRTEHMGRRTYLDAAGNLEHFEVKAVPLLDDQGEVDSTLLILRDLTQAIRSENKLFEAAREFRRITQTGDNAIWVLGEDYQVEYANPMASDLTGYSPKELLQLDFRSLLNAKGRDFLNKLPRTGRSARGCQARSRLIIRRLSGEYFTCEVCVNSMATEKGGQKTYIFMRDLSGQLQMENESRRSNEFLSNLIDSSVDGIIAADMTGTVIIFNEGAENLLGYRADEVIGKFSVVNFYPPGVAQQIMRKLRSEDFGGKGKVLPHRIIGVHKSGENIPVSLSGAMIHQDGKEIASVGIFYDLREILKAEEALLESETQFRVLFERVLHGIYFSTREGKFLDCNKAMVDLLEYADKDEFLAMEIARDLYYEQDGRAVFQQMIEADGYVKDYEVKFKRKDGSPITVLLTAHVRRDRSDRVLGYQGIVVDVTDKRKLEQQLFQTEKLAAMGRLTAQIAHELNNPIYGVMNCLDLIKSEIPETSKKRRFLDMARRETERISQLLRSMLKFFRPDEDVKSTINLNQLTEEVVLFVGKQLQEFKIQVKLDLDEGLPQIFASGNQMKQVLLNMIMNARNAMPRGGTLAISTSNDDKMVNLAIADTGVGIPQENRDRIFEAFFTTKNDVKGVGLGLSVCFGIVRDHRGKIGVESEEGVGTTFTISLPLGAG